MVYGPAADEYTRSHHALALVLGTDIFFRNGAYRPETEEGRKILAHELTHVAQNKKREEYRGASREELEREAEAAEKQVEDSGAHNKNNFYKILNDKFEPIFRKEGLEFSASDCIEGSIVHPKIPGVEQIRYKLPAMNQNNTVNQGGYKKIKAPKTVYDPSVISDEQMLQWGKEAMKNAVGEKKCKLLKPFSM